MDGLLPYLARCLFFVPILDERIQFHFLKFVLLLYYSIKCYFALSCLCYRSAFSDFSVKTATVTCIASNAL